MIRFWLTALLMVGGLLLRAQNWSIPFEQDSNYTSTYFEVINFYERLAAADSKTNLLVAGETGSGYPLHLAVAAHDADQLDLENFGNQTAGRTVLLINNAIHPGEPCGVEATMLLFRDLYTREGFDLRSVLYS